MPKAVSRRLRVAPPAPARTAVTLAAVLFAVCGAASHAGADRPPLYQHLGSMHRAITTSSPEAQRYFDQGLTLYFGFSHRQAIRFFEATAELDPGCAMAYWGIALTHGPHINNPFMDEEQSRAAWDALQKAKSLLDDESEIERGLVKALEARYGWPPPEDRAPLNEAYAAAMRDLWRAHPKDADAGALFAESLMDLRPWDLWSPEGEPRPETPEVMATLEAVMAVDSLHPGANHFYIHTMEMSPHPEKALASANRLRDLVPDAGHLVHMPAHIDIRLGHYADAILANQEGIRADQAYVAQNGRGGFYTIYRAHNYHFLTYAAMFDGRRELALQAARDMLVEVPDDQVRAMPDFVEGFLGTPYHVMVRFGMWDEILREPAPAEDYFVTRAMHHYARTIAYAATGRVDEAAREFELLKKAYEAIPGTRYIGNNPARTVMEVGLPMAEGELEYRRGNHDRAFELLGLAVQRDEALHYDEPWGWMMPARHALGALLLEQGRVADAERVYREDLARHPGNGWALKGLAECQERTDRKDEAAATTARFRQAWSRSDVAIHASCFCRRKG